VKEDGDGKSPKEGEKAGQIVSDGGRAVWLLMEFDVVKSDHL
jgi:hypothetical protein